MNAKSLIVQILPQDLPRAMRATEIAEGLELTDIKHRQWHVQPSCASNGDGIFEGFDWLSAQLSGSKRR